MTTQSRMTRLILKKAASSQNGAILRKRKKAKPKPYINRTNLTSLKDISHTRTTQTTNRIIRLRVIKPLLWFFTIHLPITKHKECKHIYQSPSDQPSSSRTNYPSNNQFDNPRPPRTARPLVKLISMSYTELLPKLIQSQLLARVPLTFIEPPYLRWYDANASCDYHYGIKGHSTKNCLALKNNVQALKNAG